MLRIRFKGFLPLRPSQRVSSCDEFGPVSEMSPLTILKTRIKGQWCHNSTGAWLIADLCGRNPRELWCLTIQERYKAVKICSADSGDRNFLSNQPHRSLIRHLISRGSFVFKTAAIISDFKLGVWRFFRFKISWNFNMNNFIEKKTVCFRAQYNNHWKVLSVDFHNTTLFSFILRSSFSAHFVQCIYTFRYHFVLASRSLHFFFYSSPYLFIIFIHFF